MSASARILNADPRSNHIEQLFAKIANWYDWFNRFFSAGIDQRWRKRLAQSVVLTHPNLVLDLATGSGDVALLLQENGLNVIGVDFCKPLLEIAKQKGVQNLMHADILHLPFENNYCDAITIAFGFRNLIDREQGLVEMLRVLKPCGYLHILEFSKPIFWLRPFYYFYLCIIMPLITGLMIRQKGAYEYLAKSILQFPEQETLKQIIQKNGYEKVIYKNYSFGIVSHHWAQKPIH